MIEVGSTRDDGKLLRCVRCNGPLRIGQHVGYTPASGAWEHDDERDCAKELERGKHTD